jgi:hypothetical protein
MVKRPAAAPSAAPQDTAVSGSFDATSYSLWVRKFDSRREALAVLGSGVHCKGHAARSVKKSGSITFLKCRLRKSQPPCAWCAILREAPGGDVELYQHPSKWREHNQRSVLQGKHGFADLATRSELSEMLVSTATTRPSTALRTVRLHGNAGKTQLRQVQTLKRQSVQARFGIKNLGQLREFVSKHSALPARHTKGFLCYSFVSPPGEKLKVTVVATTRVLQKRWVNGKDCVAAADGGFKFNLLGWPLHVLGQVNPAGNFALCGLGLTSSMASEHVTDMITGFANSVVRGTGCGPDRVKKALACQMESLPIAMPWRRHLALVI